MKWCQILTKNTNKDFYKPNSHFKTEAILLFSEELNCYQLCSEQKQKDRVGHILELSRAQIINASIRPGIISHRHTFNCGT